MAVDDATVSDQPGSYVLVLPWSPDEQGGVTRVVEELRRSIAAQGWLAPIVVVDSWDALVPRRSGSVWHLRLAAIGAATPAGLLKSLASLPLVLWRLRSWLRMVDARAVNFHFPSLSPLGVLALRRLGLFRGHVILSFHGSDVREANDVLERWLWPIIHSAADAVVACSASLADRLAVTFRIPRESVRVIHNGVDGSVYRPDAPLPAGLPDLPDSFLLSVGSFIPRKDHATLLTAFRSVADAHPGLGLVLAGAHSPGRERVMHDLQALGLAARAIVLSGLNPGQVAYLLSRCRLCVQPSLSESFPLSVLEAGAAGAVVVASRIPGHEEIIKEGVTGFMFTPRDPAQCAAAIERALADKHGARGFADALRSDVLSRFTWSGCSEAYRRLVDSDRHG